MSRHSHLSQAFATSVLLATAMLVASCSSKSDSGPDAAVDAAVDATADAMVDAGHEPTRLPNILFVIMDDVGVDQMASMGYGGPSAPAMPTIDGIAAEGVRFRNTWSMPECSPGRSALMTGRYPLRNNIFQAIGPNDLANSQVDPYEMTVPKVLAGAGYESAMFGKFHLAGPDHNEAGNGTPAQLGWDNFYGWTGGLPGSIDTTAGGIAAEGTYSCGFVPPGDEPGGADAGACYRPEAEGATSCVVISGTNAAGDPAGLQCLTLGGVLVPDATCEATPPEGIVFDRNNAHYVSPLVVNSDDAVEEATLLDPRGRGFRSTIEVNAAIEWINARADAEAPWMATLSFSSPHTPLQRPPGDLLRSDIGSTLTNDCADQMNQRRLSNAMIEALDTELGRLLVEVGIATRAEDGSLIYDPATSDTMVVVVGDNGSFGPTVRLPFDPTRAKGSAYQTGVWVPLIVSGPLAAEPGRDVEHMVNTTDVFGLFAAMAEVDLGEAVPRGTDAQAILPYLTDPTQESIRDYNFTQGGLNLQANGAVNGPCVFNGSSCSHTPVSKSVCEDNGGVWWGVGADHPDVLEPDLEHCWEVNRAIYNDDSASYETNRIAMAPTVYQAVRDDEYKLVRNWALDFDVDSGTGVGVTTDELYLIDQATPMPTLDRANSNLLADDLLPEAQARYDALVAELESVLAAQVACPGDGNGDGVVDATDIAELTRIITEWSGSSTYDFDQDGDTDEADLAVVEANLGPCPTTP